MKPEDPEETIKKILRVDKLPEVVKKKLFNKNGKLNNYTKMFILFFDALQKAFGQHFFGTVSNRTPGEIWEALLDPNPFINEICSSFMENYEKLITNKLSKEENERIKNYLPGEVLPLIHKKFVLTSMINLPNIILGLSEEDRVAYYRLFSKDSFAEPETALEKLGDIIENFQKEIDECNIVFQNEWQDQTLDAYNKKLLSKELMEFVMAESNKTKDKK